MRGGGVGSGRKSLAMTFRIGGGRRRRAWARPPVFPAARAAADRQSGVRAGWTDGRTEGLIPAALQKGRVSARGVEKSGGRNNQAGAGWMPMRVDVDGIANLKQTMSFRFQRHSLSQIKDLRLRKTIF